MPRLSTLRPSLSSLRPSVAWMPQGEQERDQHRASLPWRQWYNTTKWRKLRRQILLRDMFTCSMCGRLEGRSSQLVADHKTPHRGDERLFWDANNIWAVCKPCHDSAKQREEKTGGV